MQHNEDIRRSFYSMQSRVRYFRLRLQGSRPIFVSAVLRVRLGVSWRHLIGLGSYLSAAAQMVLPRSGSTGEGYWPFETLFKETPEKNCYLTVLANGYKAVSRSCGAEGLGNEIYIIRRELQCDSVPMEGISCRVRIHRGSIGSVGVEWHLPSYLGPGLMAKVPPENYPTSRDRSSSPSRVD
jgi:hypothetical protein